MSSPVEIAAAMAARSESSNPEHTADPKGNPWDMPGHSAGETFATWATFAGVFGLLLGVLILDFCNKQRGSEMVTTRLLRGAWNGTFGRIKRFRIEEPDLYYDIEKSKGKPKHGDDSGSDEGKVHQGAHHPEITLTQTLTRTDSTNMTEPQSITAAYFPPSCASGEAPSSSYHSMLGPGGGGRGTRGHARQGSHASTISYSSERRVAQPIPGRILTERQI